MNIKNIDCKCPYCDKNFQLGEAVQKGALEKILSVALTMKQDEIRSTIEKEKKQALEKGKLIAQQLAIKELEKKEKDLKLLEKKIIEKNLIDLQKDTLITKLEADKKNEIQLALAKQKKALHDETYKEVQNKQEQVNTLQEILNKKELKDLEKDNLISSLRGDQQNKLQIALAKQKNIYEEEKKKIKTESDLTIARLQNDMDTISKKIDSRPGELQGEIGEISIENTLRDLFPNDDVRDIPKGQEGADCILTIKNKNLRPVGKIIFESKNTEHFYEKWLVKLKQDANREKADLSILVTKTMPVDCPKVHLREGIWICRFHEYAILVRALRESINQIAKVRVSEKLRDSSAQILFDYLTSMEFFHTMEKLISPILRMDEQFRKEQKMISNSWKEREKLIQSSLDGMQELYFGIQGIAQVNLPPVKGMDQLG